jgi:phage tail-like protein
MAGYSGVLSKWKFHVVIPDITDGSNTDGLLVFQKCSSIEVDLETSEFWGGGSSYAQKYPERVMVSNVTLDFGAVIKASTAVDLWFNRCLGAVNSPSSGFKKNVEIRTVNSNGDVIETIALVGAFCKKRVYGDFDNTSSEKRIQQLELCYDYPNVTEGKSFKQNVDKAVSTLQGGVDYVGNVGNSIAGISSFVGGLFGAK